MVQKYGGTSVANSERIRKVAEHIIRSYRKGYRLVVVLSAQAGETDSLLKAARELAKASSPREMDVLLATGEQKSVALMALYLQSQNIPAVSLLGYQIPMMTNEDHMRARIQNIGIERIQNELKQKKVVIAAGFQGVTRQGEITTFGRGGSDTSAVALAIALKADLCEIYTDVEGVYTTDPRKIPEARLMKSISYEEMMEMADSGAKVLQTRSVELAGKENMPIQVRSAFNFESAGTLVHSEEASLEKVIVSSITCNTQEVKIAFNQIKSSQSVLPKVFGPIAQANINVDMIVENLGDDGTADLAFTLGKGDLARALPLITQIGKSLNTSKIEVTENIAKISIVGLGMRSHAGVAAKIFEILDEEGIVVQMVSTSEIKVELIVDVQKGETVLKLLHQAFDLNLA